MDVSRLNAGCGTKILANSINLDKFYHVGVNVIADLNRCLPFKDCCFEQIDAEHCLEHLDDFIGPMNEFYRVLKYQGHLRVVVPWWAGQHALGDPTHKRMFSHRSFIPFTEEWERFRHQGISGPWKVNKVEFLGNSKFNEDKFLAVGGFSPIEAMEIVLEKVPERIKMV